MLKKDSVYVYLKNDDNEKIRKVFKDLNFKVDEFKNGKPKQVRYEIYKDISKDTKNTLLEIIELESANDFHEVQRRFMHIHPEEIIFCGLPYEYMFPKAMRLINYGIGALRNDEILLNGAQRYILRSEEEEDGEYSKSKIKRLLGNYTRVAEYVEHSETIDFHEIEIVLSKKDRRLNTIYSGKEKLKITSTNMIYPEVYEELHKVKKLIGEGKHVEPYINMLNYSHTQKIKDMEPYTREEYEPFSPDKRARQLHFSRAQWESPPKDKEELNGRISFLLQHIFEIDTTEFYRLENNYPDIEL